MYLLFTENHTALNKPAIGDGSYLSLAKCQEGWFALPMHRALIDELGWEYTEVQYVTIPEVEL